MCSVDVTDALMTDVIGDAAKPAGSDVGMTSSSPTSRDLVVKAEVVGHVEEDYDDSAGAAAAAAVSQRLPGGPEWTTADGDRSSPGAGPSVNGGGQQLRPAVNHDDDHVDDDVLENEFPSDEAAEVAASSEHLLEQPLSTSGDDALKYIEQKASVSDTHRAVVGQCRVCGDEATGMYFGALVCVPCKVNQHFHAVRTGDYAN